MTSQTGIRMFCQGCGWSFVQETSAAMITKCPVCYGTTFANGPGTECEVQSRHGLEQQPKNTGSHGTNGNEHPVVIVRWKLQGQIK